MKAEYREGKTPGFGKLVFSEALLPDAPWSVSIQRGSDRCFLSGNPQNPWVKETIFINLEGAATADGSLELNVGPRIVDRLDQTENYRAQLRGATGEPQKCPLKIPSISYTPGGSLDNMADVPPEENAAAVNLADEPEKPVEKPAPPEPAPESAPDSRQPEPLEMEPQQQRAAAKMPWLKWAILAVLAIGCVAWFLLDPRKEEAQKAAEQPEEKAAAVASAEDQVAAFFKGGQISPLQAARLAEKLPKSTNADKDAVYRLLYFAAENGETSALDAYGAALDPSLPQWGSIEKNAPEAWNAYRKLPDQEKAAKALTHLRAWLEEQSRNGNKQAAAWLREIEK